MTIDRPGVAGAMRSFFKDVVRVLGFRLVYLAVLTVIMALLEGLTIALLLPLFSSLGFASSGMAGTLNNVVTHVLAAVGLTFTPLNVSILLIAVLVVGATVALAQAYYSTRLQAEYVANWQRTLFEAMTSARWSFLRLRRGGDIAAALTTEAARLERAFYRTNLVFSSAVAMVIQIVIAAAIAPAVTFMILIFGALLFYLTRPFTRRAMLQGSELTKANSSFLARVGEITAAMKLIKATAREREGNRVIGLSIDQIERLSFIQHFDVQMVRAAFEYMGAAAVALLLISGTLLLGVEVSTIIVVLAMFVRVFPRITGLRQSVQAIVVSLPAYESIQEMYRSAVAHRESDAHRALAPLPAGPASVSFDGVCVYGHDNAVILDNVSFEMSAGSFTAVVGPSGAGKTTLVDCVIGLVEPQAGNVLADGVPLTSVAPALWRRGIGYLGQEPVLFAGSIRENVTWGREDLSDAAVAAALVAAGAGFVLDLPRSFDTVIAEGGGSLSGGERQRIALARALCGTMRLLILDEATSAMDVETEAAVMAAVVALRGRTTILSVSHRLSTVRDADEIIVLDCGSIVERGRFEGLLAQGGRFSALWNAPSGTGYAEGRVLRVP